MNDDQIAALAREYAEWVTQQEGDKAYIPAEQAIASAFLHWLTHRFCLVEKEAVRKQFKSAKRLIEARNYNKQCIGVGSRGVLERLFPEIAKEVEG